MSVRDAISHAINGDPAAMKDSLSSTLDSKVADALELKRISVASEYFNELDATTSEEAEEALEAQDPRVPNEGPTKDWNKYLPGSRRRTKAQVVGGVGKKKPTTVRAKDMRYPPAPGGRS